MKISLNWIKDFVEVDSKMKPGDLGDLITTKTAEIEEYVDLADSFKNIVVGKIKEIKPHPDADKLQIAETLIGGKTLQIVCGAPIYEGMLAPVALTGAMVKWHGEGDLIELKPTKVRGVMSDAMLCTGAEIGLENKDGEIYDLTPLGPKVGTPLAKVFSKDDIVFEVDNKSLTHRPDLWGHYGMAREVAAITGKKLKKLDLDVKFPEKGESPDIEIKDHDLCPRYCGVIIKNIETSESPQWMKDRLMAVGYRPISTIVDVTNYVMAELGQPLHAFDKSFIKKGIIVRRAEKGEQITTLDGQKRKLDADMLVIADHEKPVAIAGVMGSENSEINDGTTEIIIESANFNPQSIRTTSTRLGLRTEAVQRFEKSLDPVLAETAIKRTCELILKLHPEAKIAGPITDVKKIKITRPVVELDVKKAVSKIGVLITATECKKILESLEFEVNKKSDDVLTVTVPTWRATKDVDIEDDLVEEIVRMYGYDNIPATLPDLPIAVPMKNKERTLKHEARSILAGLGLTEVYNYAFYGQEEIDKTLISEWQKYHLEIENPLSQDQTHLRISLVPNVLKSLAANLRFYPKFKLFEVGRRYREHKDGKYFPLEEKWICGAIVIPKKSKQEVFYEAKAVAESFMKKFLKTDIEFEKETNGPPYTHPSRSANIALDKNVLGGVFEVHPTALKNWDIEAKVALFEINFTALAELEETVVHFNPIPKFPGLDIDISVVIDRKKTVASVTEAIKKADKDLIANVKLFDIYEGEGIGEDKKALAFKVLMQAEDRTLNDEEMAIIQKRIFKNLEKLGGTIRGA